MPAMLKLIPLSRNQPKKLSSKTKMSHLYPLVICKLSCKGPAVLQIRVFCQDIRHGEVTKASDDAGNEEEQRPEQGEEPFEQARQEHVAIVLHKTMADALEGGLISWSALQKETAGPNLKREHHQQGEEQAACCERRKIGGEQLCSIRTAFPREGSS